MFELSRRKRGGLLVISLSVFLLLRCIHTSSVEHTEEELHKVDALMPDYSVEHEEAYLCTAVPLPDKPLKLVGIEPLSTQQVVHHMLLFGARLGLHSA